jgi:hypothetical protein
MLVLALDPAADGAAVLLLGLPGQPVLVVAAWAWRLGQMENIPTWICTRAWSPPLGAPPPDVARVTYHRTPGVLGSRIGSETEDIVRLMTIERDRAQPAIDAFLIEGAYVGRDPHASLRVARFGGFVAGGIQASLDRCPSAIELAPKTWRMPLGLNATRRPEAKARSLAGIPALVPSIKPILARLGKLDHLTDATGVGYVGVLYDATRPGFADRVSAAAGSG